MKLFQHIPFLKRIAGHRERVMRRAMRRELQALGGVVYDDNLFIILSALDGLKERLDSLEAHLGPQQ